MAIVVVLAILFSCILLILCLPITYALTVHIGTPFQVEAREAGAGSWPIHPGPIPWAKNRITSCIPAGSAALP